MGSADAVPAERGSVPSQIIVAVVSAVVIFLENVKSLRRQLKATDLVQGFGIVPPQSYRYVDEECIALLSDERFQNSGRYKRSYRTRGPSARSNISR